MALIRVPVFLYFEADDASELDEEDVFVCTEQDDSWELNSELKLVLFKQLPAEDASTENDEVPPKRKSRAFDESRSSDARNFTNGDIEETDSDNDGAASLVDIYGQPYGSRSDDDV